MLFDIVALIVTAKADSMLDPAANPMMMSAGMALAIAGSAILVALGASVAYSSHKRRNQKDWEVKVWRMSEKKRSEPKMPNMRQDRNVEFH
jgi:hypothetical protein